MNYQKKAAFSPDSKYFAYDANEVLLIWETASKKFKECKFDRALNTCSSINWIPVHHKYNSPKKAKLCHNYPAEYTLLAIGTVKGDILIYNISSENLFLHLVGRHNGAVNDMYFYTKNNSFFTCSSDHHVAIWDISSGKEISKWKAGENPVSSICVIDDENLLTASTSVLWWNIPEKTILKKFSSHSTEIYKLLPVNADSMNSCYFLSAAVDDTKISAWSLNSSTKSDVPVASFSLSQQPQDMDISRVSSKNKPLVLATVTKDGYLHLFELALNGNISQPVKPQVSVEINSDCQNLSVISIKLTPDYDSCIIAYETSKSAVAFKHVKIKELLQKDGARNAVSEISESSVKLQLENYSSEIENPPVNGISDSVLSNYKQKLRSSMKSPLTVSKFANPTKKKVAVESQLGAKQVDLDDPKRAVESLLEAIEERNNNIIEAILKNNSAEYVSSVVKNLPTNQLEIVLNELNHRLIQKYSESTCRWLKEILHIHLRYLTQCETSIESLNQVKKHLDSMKIDETLHKMTSLQGLLNLQTLDSSSNDESDSEDEEPMEL